MRHIILEYFTVDAAAGGIKWEALKHSRGSRNGNNENKNENANNNRQPESRN